MSGAPRAARVRAQGKLNLFLRILAREASGWHQIETLFTRVALADVVTVRAGGRGRALRVAGPELPAAGLGADERNLAWRAADAYARATGWPEGFEIGIEKRIPVGGGMGGGSADAAAVLRALDALSPRGPLGEARLVALAAALGADVPFLASGAAHALAWGRGDRLLPLPPPPEAPVALLLPPFGVSTAEAYGWVAASRAAGFAAGAALLDLGALSRWEGIAALAANDFEAPVGERHPELAALREALGRGGAPIARMSGSGSALFAVGGAGIAPELPPGARLVRTRTSASVEEVEVLE